MVTEYPRELAAKINPNDVGGTGMGGSVYERQGMASKYSPILNQRGVEGGADAAERRKLIGQG
jgi:hypothetical protein